MRTLDELLEKYGESHQNIINKRIHWVCVPTIFVSIVAMLYASSALLAYIVTVLVIAYYVRLSLALGLGMGLFIGSIFWLLSVYPVSFMTWLLIFVVAWVGQFVGHHIEGKKPSFLDDLQFLLVGPAWVAKTLGEKILGKFVRSPKPA